jgi:hypothetical protein
MKHHKYIAITLFILFISVPFLVSAKGFGLKRPVGGRVTKTGSSAEIVCSAASGPIFIKPFNVAVPGPFFIRTTNNGTPKKGGYLLGNYTAVPDVGTCYNPETGAPVPAFELKPYGASK